MELKKFLKIFLHWKLICLDLCEQNWGKIALNPSETTLQHTIHTFILLLSFCCSWNTLFSVWYQLSCGCGATSTSDGIISSEVLVKLHTIVKNLFLIRVNFAQIDSCVDNQPTILMAAFIFWGDEKIPSHLLTFENFTLVLWSHLWAENCWRYIFCRESTIHISCQSSVCLCTDSLMCQ